MKQIAIISDTHGLLRDQVLAELNSADYILHAGDFTTPHILEAIQDHGVTYAVRGNNDKEWDEPLPDNLRVTIEGIRFFLVHKKNDIPQDLADVDVIIYGHSHKYSSEVMNGVLYLNPGSCGKRRFNLEITMCKMMVDAGQYRYDKIIIPT